MKFTTVLLSYRRTSISINLSITLIPAFNPARRFNTLFIVRSRCCFLVKVFSNVPSNQWIKESSIFVERLRQIESNNSTGFHLLLFTDHFWRSCEGVSFPASGLPVAERGTVKPLHRHFDELLGTRKLQYIFLTGRRLEDDIVRK